MVGSIASEPGSNPVTSSSLNGGYGLFTRPGLSVLVPVGGPDEVDGEVVAPVLVESPADELLELLAVIPELPEGVEPDPEFTLLLLDGLALPTVFELALLLLEEATVVSVFSLEAEEAVSESGELDGFGLDLFSATDGVSDFSSDFGLVGGLWFSVFVFEEAEGCGGAESSR